MIPEITSREMDTEIAIFIEESGGGVRDTLS